VSFYEMTIVQERKDEVPAALPPSLIATRLSEPTGGPTPGVWQAALAAPLPVQPIAAAAAVAVPEPGPAVSERRVSLNHVNSNG
jgi:hypothetical protein